MFFPLSSVRRLSRMAPKEKKTKEQIAAAAAAGSKKNKKVGRFIFSCSITSK